MAFVSSSIRQDTLLGRRKEWALRYLRRPPRVIPTRAAVGPRTNAIRSSLILEASAGPSRRAVLWRLCQLSFFFLYWVVGNGIDRLVTKQREEARLRAASRLRDYIKKMGGTLIKLGQQASLRSDLLPEEYCDQLGDLLDDVPPFPVSEAYRAIEQHTGKPWQETFAVFTSDPVGSASIACVYRAFLRNGDEVAIKVRRPGIREAFLTDLAVIDIVAKFLEFLTIIRPGLSESFRSELRTMLVEELDFRSEVRYQELFRRYLRRRKKLDVTAPKIYYELSGHDVIVSEFVKGISAREMMAELNAAGGEEYLEYLRGLEIDPRRIAKRLIRSQHYQFHECPFFHGDPHPGNILVQPGGRIVMIDFGACGVFSSRDRNLMLQMQYYYTRGDVAGMVQCVIGLMEPIPAIDVDAFSKYLQDEWWKGYYGIISKHADWSERSSFRLWVALLRGFRKFSIPMPLHLIRMVRATLLYDTVAAQLYSKINVFEEFAKYYAGVAQRARRHTQQAAIRQILLGPDDSAYLKLRQITDVGNALLFRLQKFLAEPDVNFLGEINKVYSFIESVVQLFKTAIMTTVVAWFIGSVLVLCRDAISYYALGHKDVDWSWTWSWTLSWIWNWTEWRTSMSNDHMLQVIIVASFICHGLTMWSHGRRTLFEFERKDNYRFTHRAG